VALDGAPGPYPARRLVPGRFTEAHRWAYVVMPLRFGVEETGFLLCELSAMSGTAHESLVNQLSRALKASALVKEERRHADELEARVEERTRELREAQQQLVEIAHQAGMAEIAVGVLHNVGNLLNSVSVAAEAIESSAGDCGVAGLGKLDDLLQSHRDDLGRFFSSDPRGALVPEYCHRLASSLEAERQRLFTEIEGLQGNVALVRETVVSLQEYARYGQDGLLTEPIRLPAMIEAALRIQAADLARSQVQVWKRIADVPPVLAQRFKVVHVLVNLIKNAVEAMQRTPAEARLLRLELVGRPDGAVELVVADSGEGIPRENLDRLFSYAFTTKRGGHGFGLHTCANYLKQMGGSLTVESEGPGRGARFALVFRAAGRDP
jgi:two-component system, NtrC family, sensor kinase